MAPQITDSRVRTAINAVISMLQKGDIEQISRAVFRGEGRPLDKWSACNRLICFFCGTTDARGFKQWNAVGRSVKKGSHAFYILAPLIRPVPRMVEDANGEKKTVMVEALTGFTPIPVFRVEDTEGAPIKIPPPADIPFNFESLIRELGLKVETAFFSGGAYGWYSPGHKTIRLMSPDKAVFYHELAHAVHERVSKKPLKGGQDKEQELIAELSASVLMHLTGFKPSSENKKYLEHYSAGDWNAVMRVLATVDKVISFILQKTRAGAVAPAPQIKEPIKNLKNRGGYDGSEKRKVWQLRA